MEPTTVVLSLGDLLTQHLPQFASAMIAIWGNVMDFALSEQGLFMWLGLLAWLFVMGSKGLKSLIPGL